MKPVLYITATPIGSLADASQHARDVLTQADLIVCEDTRSTKKLLNALNINNQNLESLHANNEINKTDYIIKKIFEKNLSSIVIVSDAGTPAISDPGAYFIAKAHENNIQVKNVPGPSSLIAAVAASGFVQPRVLFSGFLLRTKAKQQSEFLRWSYAAPCTAVFFESPNRLVKTFTHLLEYFKEETSICISREISKKFEENAVMRLDEALEFLSKAKIMGEYVVSMEVLTESYKKIEHQAYDEMDSLKLACKNFAENYKLSAKDLYNFLMKQKNSD